MTLHEFPLLHDAYSEAVLPNGLTVRVVRRPGFAKKYAFLGVNYGSIDTHFTLNGQEITTPDGVAHYLEHKMFDLPGGNAMDRFAAAGAQDNAFTSYTMTAYFFDCADAFEQNLQTLLEMVCTPCFTDESVEKERGIIAQEIREYEDSPSSVVYEQLFSAMYPTHPASVPIAGSVESIQAITAETLQTCYDAFYTPANMMLCVVGDVEPDMVLELAERFTPSGQKRVPEADYGPTTLLIPPEKLVRRHMEITMPTFQLGFACPPPWKRGEVLEQEVLADLAAELLMGESTPLYTALYEEGLIDSSFGCGYDELKGLAMISAGGDSDEPERVLERIMEEKDRLLREGPQPGMLERLKRAALGSRIRGLDSFDGVAARMCGYFFEGAEYYDFPRAYERVDEAQVLAFLQENVRPERASLSIIEPKEKEA